MNRNKRRLAREVAKSVYERGLRGRDAEEAFKNDPRVRNLDPETILTLIKIALIIWTWWSKNNDDTGTYPED